MSFAQPEALPTTAEIAERIDTGKRLTHVLLELDEPYKTTLLLRFHEGLPATEIARRQGIPEGTVRWRTKRGIDELRTRLEREFGGPRALGVLLFQFAAKSREAPVAVSPTATATSGGLMLVGTKGIVAGVAIAAVLAVAWIGFSSDEESAAKTKAERSVQRALAHGQPGDGPSPDSTRSMDDQVPPLATGASRVSARESEMTQLLIFEADGRPNQGQLAVLAAATGREAQSKRIDAEGRVAFPASGATRELSIERIDAFPFHAVIQLVPGEQVVSLPTEEVLAGRIVVDGRAPLRPMKLDVYSARYENTALFAKASGHASLAASNHAFTSTDEAGFFRVRGLTAGESVSLRLPEGYAKPGTADYAEPGQGPVFQIEGPVSDLLIEVERHVSVHGYVLEADGRTPVSGAFVRVNVEGSVWGRSADEDGYFEVFLRRPPRDVEVQYGRPRISHDWVAGATVEFHFDEPEIDTDLGDLVLSNGHSLVLEVRDLDGKPIPGAISSHGPAADEEGRSLLMDIEAGVELIVKKRGYRSEQLTLPEPMPTDLTIVLEPTNDLTIEVQDADGRQLRDIELELSAPEWFLSDAERATIFGSRTWAFRRRMHDGTRGSVWGGSPTRIRYRTDENGRVSLGEVAPHLSLALSVVDSAGATLHERSLPPLGPEERRHVRVRLEAELRTLRGRVVDASGEPVLDARVRVGQVGNEPTRSPSRSDWRGFEFSRVREGDVRLSVRSRGYLPLDLGPLDWPDEELVLVLERGEDLVVSVVDSLGSAVAGGEVRARPVEGGTWLAGNAISDGVFEIVGLGRALHDVELELPSGVLRMPRSPGQGTIVFEVPARGEVILSWDMSAYDVSPDHHGAHVRLEPLDPRYGAMTRHLTTVRGSMRFDQIVGEYRLVLVALLGTKDGQGYGDDIDWRPLAVTAGETALIYFEP